MVSRKKVTEKRISVLYWDLESSGSIKIGKLKKSKVKRYIQQRFTEVAEDNRCDRVVFQAFKGDEAFAYFRDDGDCIKAGIELVVNMHDVI